MFTIIQRCRWVCFSYTILIQSLSENGLWIILPSPNLWLSNATSSWLLLGEIVQVTQLFQLCRSTPTVSFLLSVHPRRSLMNSGLCRTLTQTSSFSASAWSTPPPSTTSPRSGSRKSARTTRHLPSSWWAPSQISSWTSMSSSTWTAPTSSLCWAPGLAAWQTRSEQPTMWSVHRSRKRTWKRRLTRPSLQPSRPRHARARRGGPPWGVPKRSPGAAGRSSSASSEPSDLKWTQWVVNRLYLFEITLFLSSRSSFILRSLTMPNWIQVHTKLIGSLHLKGWVCQIHSWLLRNSCLTWLDKCQNSV